MITGQDKFIYDFHFADHAPQAVIDMGETDYKNFIKEFNNFPWLEQLDIANSLKNTSATITAQDCLNKTDLWTSIAGNRNQWGYIMGYNFPKIVRGSFFRKERTVKWVRMYATRNEEKILKCYDLFFKRNATDLALELAQLDFYGESKGYQRK
jgi:hypothetical protein